MRGEATPNSLEGAGGVTRGGRKDYLELILREQGEGGDELEHMREGSDSGSNIAEMDMEN